MKTVQDHTTGSVAGIANRLDTDIQMINAIAPCTCNSMAHLRNKNIRQLNSTNYTMWWGTDMVTVWSEVQMICTWSSWCHCHAIISLFHPLVTRLPTRPDSSLRYRRYINHLLTYLLTLAPVKSRMVYLSGAGLPMLSWKKAVKACSVVV